MQKHLIGTVFGASLSLASASWAQDATPSAAADLAQVDAAADEATSDDLSAQAEATPPSTRDVDTITVTGEKQVDRSASAGTKFNADPRDLPVSVQVIPRELIDSQLAFRPSDLIQNVSGVFRGNPNFGDNFIFRGFASSSEYFRDGYADRRESVRETANIEQLEVLKGPASVLYGRVEPGGTLNYVTKKPLSNSRNSVSVQADEFGLFRYTADLAAANTAQTFGVRFNGATEDGENFRDFSFSDRRFGSVSALWRISDATTLSVEAEALDDNRLFDRGIINIGDRVARVPVSRFTGEATDFRDVTERLGGYTIEHQLSEVWKLKHAVRYTDQEDRDARTEAVPPFAATGILERDFRERAASETQLTAQLELYGTFKILGLWNQLLLGVDRDRNRNDSIQRQFNDRPESNNLDIFAPVYGNFVTSGEGRLASNNLTELESTAYYLQSLVNVLPAVKLLLGVRYDDTDNRSLNRNNDRLSKTSPSATSPRFGVVVQPLDGTSLYASYSEAFTPLTGSDFAGDPFDPILSDQIEVGIKQNLFSGAVLATLAAYRITRENLTTPDPDSSGFSIQTGEVESEGLELDLSGSPLLGLSITASVSYNEARVTEDTRAVLVGRPLQNVPDFGASAWISYEPQQDFLRGYGVGVGARHVTEREAAATESYILPTYTRLDASVWWRNQHWRVALKADNLADKRYFESALDTRGAYPGTPRAFSARVSYDF